MNQGIWQSLTLLGVEVEYYTTPKATQIQSPDTQCHQAGATTQGMDSRNQDIIGHREI